MSAKPPAVDPPNVDIDDNTVAAIGFRRSSSPLIVSPNIDDTMELKQPTTI
jgi:hypothetical protein